MPTKNKIGLFGARTCNSGLGTQTLELAKNIKFDKIAVIDISEIDNKKVYKDRFNDLSNEVTTIKGFPTDKQCYEFLKGLNVVYCVEIPYNYNLFRIAKILKVKTILNYNYEFLDYLNQENLPLPDVLLSPSTWHLNNVINKFGNRCKVVHIPFPVSKIEKTPKTKAKTFVHVAGYQLYEDRNGTDALLEAVQHIKAQDIKIIIYSQHKLNKAINDKRLEIKEMNLDNYQDLYKNGDVLILPRRYGGQSLQLNEAMASGMIPIMTNMKPQNEFLDEKCLIKHLNFKKIMTRTNIDCAIINPKEIAEKIDEMANMKQTELMLLQRKCHDYIDLISWDNLKNKYLQLLYD